MAALAARSCQVLFDYEAKEDWQISVLEGQVVKVILDEGDGWVAVEVESGSQGQVPRSYLDLPSAAPDLPPAATDLPPPATNRILMEGWLGKMGSLVTNWKTRWCVLQGPFEDSGDCFFSYYDKKPLSIPRPGDAPKGRLALRGGSVTRPSRDESNTKYFNFSCVDSDGRVLKLRSLERTDREAWCVALDEAVKLCAALPHPKSRPSIPLEKPRSRTFSEVFLLRHQVSADGGGNDATAASLASTPLGLDSLDAPLAGAVDSGIPARDEDKPTAPAAEGQGASPDQPSAAAETPCQERRLPTLPGDNDATFLTADFG
jgi:hypothetical protein